MGEDLPVAPPNAGPKTFPEGYDGVANQAIINIPSIPGGKVFAGPRDDPFFIDIGAAFDLLNTGRGIPTGASPGIDNLAGFNVLSIVVQVPITAVGRPQCNINDPSDMDCVVGMWITTTSRQATRVLRGEDAATSSGDWVQVARQSAALVNELVVPTAMKDAFGASNPKNDERFLGLVQDPIPARDLNKLFGLPVPPTPRQDLVTIFLTSLPGLNQPPDVEPAEIAHLNVAVPVNPQPNRLGVIGGDTQAIRTDGVSPTMQRISRCAPRRAAHRSLPSSTWRRITSSATGSTQTTSRSWALSLTWPHRMRATIISIIESHQRVLRRR